MEKIDGSEADRVSEALVIWIGPMPSNGYDREAALVACFGERKAGELVPLLLTLREAFFRAMPAASPTLEESRPS